MDEFGAQGRDNVSTPSADGNTRSIKQKDIPVAVLIALQHFDIRQERNCEATEGMLIWSISSQIRQTLG